MWLSSYSWWVWIPLPNVKVRRWLIKSGNETQCYQHGVSAWQSLMTGSLSPRHAWSSSICLGFQGWLTGQTYCYLIWKLLKTWTYGSPVRWNIVKDKNERKRPCSKNSRNTKRQAHGRKTTRRIKFMCTSLVFEQFAWWGSGAKELLLRSNGKELRQSLGTIGDLIIYLMQGM